MGRRSFKSEPKTSAWKPVACAFILLAVMLASNARAETIEDTQFGFTLVVPHGYIHLPANGDNVHIFSTSDPADGWPDALVSLQRMHRKIGRGHVPLSSNAPAGSRQFFVKWKTYDVEVLAQHITMAGMTLAGRSVQIPLRNEAIQINLVVPLGKEGTADSVLAQFLSGLDGRSNWDDMRQLSSTEISSGAICLFWIAIFYMKRSPNAVPRHRRAAKIGLGITAAVFVLLLLAGVIIIRNSGDSPEDQRDRGFKVAVSAVLLSGWLGLSGYGCTRLVLRMRRGPTPKSPPPLYSGQYGSIIIPDE